MILQVQTNKHTYIIVSCCVYLVLTRRFSLNALATLLIRTLCSYIKIPVYNLKYLSAAAARDTKSYTRDISIDNGYCR